MAETLPAVHRDLASTDRAAEHARARPTRGDGPSRDAVPGKSPGGALQHRRAGRALARWPRHARSLGQLCAGGSMSHSTGSSAGDLPVARRSPTTQAQSWAVTLARQRESQLGAAGGARALALLAIIPRTGSSALRAGRRPRRCRRTAHRGHSDRDRASGNRAPIRARAGGG
jgi:hypothetical protein